jgi:hypothetical protein
MLKEAELITNKTEKTVARVSQHMTNAGTFMKSGEDEKAAAQLRIAARASISLAEILIGMAVKLKGKNNA